VTSGCPFGGRCVLQNASKCRYLPADSQSDKFFTGIEVAKFDFAGTQKAAPVTAGKKYRWL